MNKDFRFYVKRTHGEPALLEWLPSSGTARIYELLDLLKATLPAYETESIDLIEESTGRPVGAETEVESLECRTLLIKDHFIEYTARQLESLKAQSRVLAGFEVPPNSSVFRLKLHLPGLVRVKEDNLCRVFVRGRHELLMILPGSFPEVAPKLVWQTPIFHPNLAAHSEVWPPDYHWEDAHGVVPLIEALGETLVGLRTTSKGLLNSLRRRGLNSEASSWFRKHRKSIATFGGKAIYALVDAYVGFPLFSQGSMWRLTGRLTGGSPLIFLSPLFWNGIPSLAENAPRWLLGQRGALGELRWYYVERMAPVHGSGIQPDTAIGLYPGRGIGSSPSWNDECSPLQMGSKDQQTVFRYGKNSREVKGYFTRIGNHPDERIPGRPPPSIAGLQIRVGGQGGNWTQPGESEIIDSLSEEGQSQEQRRGSPQIIERAQRPQLCMYCGTICASDEDWRVCDRCDTPVHEDCWELLGGCAYTGCTRCPLFVG